MKRFAGVRAYVTGATGFIGGAVARRLVDEGATVTALVRPQTDATALRALGVAVHAGNVTEPATLDLRDQDLVVHAAAWVGFGVPKKRHALYRATNVEGTANVLDAARRADVPKVVHVSSIAAVARTATTRPARESDFDAALPGSVSLYESTKVEAHRLAIESGLHVAIVMPGVVLGPGGPFEPIFRRFAEGRLPALLEGDGVKGWVHVDDVAEGTLLAALKGNGPYILVDDSVTFTELVARLSHAIDVPAPKSRVGVATLARLVAAVESGYHLVGKTPPVSRELVASLREDMRYDATRAREQLGWAPDMWTRTAADLLKLKLKPKPKPKPKGKGLFRRA